MAKYQTVPSTTAVAAIISCLNSISSFDEAKFLQDVIKELFPIEENNLRTDSSILAAEQLREFCVTHLTEYSKQPVRSWRGKKPAAPIR